MTNKINSIAVFCGSSSGNKEIYSHLAMKLADCFIESNITLIYGGATVGLMGVLANTILSRSGKVIGVIPQSLFEKEIAHQGLTKLHVVNSMHERKALMADLSQAFLMLPGGAGSLDEFFEIYTWGQLGIHKKPFGILNVDHYYDHLLKFLDHTVAEGFIKQVQREMILVDESPTGILNKFANYEAPITSKWIKSSSNLGNRVHI